MLKIHTLQAGQQCHEKSNDVHGCISDEWTQFIEATILRVEVLSLDSKFLLAILPPGAFITMGILIAVKNMIDAKAAELAPIQAFVVETQITGNQENVNQIEGQAEFGG